MIFKSKYGRFHWGKVVKISIKFIHKSTKQWNAFYGSFINYQHINRLGWSTADGPSFVRRKHDRHNGLIQFYLFRKSPCLPFLYIKGDDFDETKWTFTQSDVAKTLLIWVVYQVTRPAGQHFSDVTWVSLCPTTLFFVKRHVHTIKGHIKCPHLWLFVR